MNMVIYHLSLSSLCFMHMQAPGHTVAQKLDAPFCLSMCRRLVCLVSVLCSVSVWESDVFMHLDLVRKMDRICVLQQRTWKKNWITNPSAIYQLLRAIVNSCIVIPPFSVALPGLRTPIWAICGTQTPLLMADTQTPEESHDYVHKNYQIYENLHFDTLNRVCVILPVVFLQISDHDICDYLYLNMMATISFCLTSEFLWVRKRLYNGYFYENFYTHCYNKMIIIRWVKGGE